MQTQIKCGHPATIQIISRVNSDTIEDLRGLCRSLIGLMQPSYSRYTKKGGNRWELWLFHKIHLGNGQITKGYYDDRLWQFCQRVYPGCDIGLLTFGGKHETIVSTGLIDKHGDHEYAQPIARTVNLGSCIFGFGNGDNHNLYRIADGQIIEFNCKVCHSVQEILTPERFSINLWKFNQARGYYPLP